LQETESTSGRSQKEDPKSMYGKQTERAIGAMSRLAEVWDGGKTRLSAFDIADQRGLPRPMIAKILTTLSQARPVVSALLGERAATASAAGAMIDALAAMDAAIAGGSAAKSTVAGAPHGTAAHPAPSQPLAAWLPEALQAIQPIMTQRPALAELAERAKRWSSALPLVDAWHAWLHAARSAREVGLAPLVDAVSSARIAPDECAAAAERAMLRAWLSSLRDNMEQFRSFDPVVAERMAESYARALDASRAAVGKRAAAAVKQRFLQLDAERGGPASEQLARLAELRALQRPRRSIRTLIRQTGAALAAV
jgi:hypothetical protein